MKKGTQNFMNAINQKADAFDYRDPDYADVANPESEANRIKGNPIFAATFNIKLLTRYFTLNTGSYTAIAAASLNAALKNSLPFFIFGNSDYQSGFRNVQGEFPLNTNWAYGIAGVVGRDEFTALAFDATVLAELQTGDLVIPFTSALPGTGTTTLALNILRCSEVAYGSILGAIASDRFQLNGARYVLVDKTKQAQYANQWLFGKLSVFGKFEKDSLTPNDYKKPEQFQDGIVDVPIVEKWGSVDKHLIWGLFNDFDNINSSITLYSPQVRKLSQ